VPRILVIDDDPPTRRMAVLLMARLGYPVSTADCGRAALDAVRVRAFDLVLADLNLGDLTALDLLRAFRGMGLRVPVVVLTGFGSIGTAVEAMKLGASDYLEKPLDGDVLEHVLRSTLQTSGAVPLIESASYASAMWADAVMSLTRSSIDVKNFDEWGRVLGMSASSVRRVCRAACQSPRASLTLARLLRAVVCSLYQPWRPAERLRVSDPRTLARMLNAGGLPTAGNAITVDEFLTRQRLVSHELGLQMLRSRVDQMCGPSATLKCR
jgi:DNA-binding response OmpR family regulator